MPSSPDRAVLRGAPASEASRYTPAPFAAVEPRPAPDNRAASAPTASNTPTSQPQVRLDEVYAAELNRIREEARAQGHAQGHEEGLRAAEADVIRSRAEIEERYRQAHSELERELVSASAALTNAARLLEERTQPVAEDLAKTLTDASFTLVSDLLGRELSLATDPGRDAIQRVLTIAPTDAPLHVRLHPNDYATLSEDVLSSLPATIKITPDPLVEPAGALAESGARRIDAQIATALQRVRETLLG